MSSVLVESIKKGNLDDVSKFFSACNNDTSNLLVNGWNPLHYACDSNQPQIVRWLLENVASLDVNAKTDDEHGFTPLHIAAERGFAEVAEVLIKSGKNIKFRVEAWGNNKSKNSYYERFYDEYTKVQNFKQRAGYTPLQIACARGDAAIAKLIIDNDKNLNLQDDDCMIAFHISCRLSHIEVVKLFLNFQGSRVSLWGMRSTALHNACRSGNIDLVNLLFEHKADINQRNSINHDARTALHEACMISEHATENDRSNSKIVELLLEKGSDINLQTKLGLTPLHYACQRGDIEIVKVLLNRGATTNIIDDEEMSPILYAFDKGHKDVVALVIKHEEERRKNSSSSSSSSDSPAYLAQLELVKLLSSDDAKKEDPVVADLLRAKDYHKLIQHFNLLQQHQKQQQQNSASGNGNNNNNNNGGAGGGMPNLVLLLSLVVLALAVLFYLKNNNNNNNSKTSA